MEKRNFKTIAVIMSTYNGEKFIRKQIDSILFQQNVNIILCIRDDGSKDSTIEIINTYKRYFKNIIISEEFCGDNLGPMKSF